MAVSMKNGQYRDIRMTPDTNKPLESVGQDALKDTIFNIFKTGYGERGAIFNPDWGSTLRIWLHEPIDENTANAIKLTLAEELRRMHGLVTLNFGKTIVEPLKSGPPGYYIKIVLEVSPLTQSETSFDFNIYKGR